MDVRVGLWRKLSSTEELMLLNCVLEKTLESSLDCKEIQPVHPKGIQSWIFIWRNEAEAEAPILRPPDVKNQLIGKDPDAGKDWRQEEKGWQSMMVEWITGSTDMSLTNSRRWWRIGRPGMLQSLGSQRVGHNQETEQQQAQWIYTDGIRSWISAPKSRNNITNI